MKNDHIYQAMLTEHERIGFPITNVTDLTIGDRRELSAMPENPHFFWAVRHDGTSIADLRVHKAGSAILNVLYSQFDNLFVCEDGALREIDREEAFRIARLNQD